MPDFVRQSPTSLGDAHAGLAVDPARSRYCLAAQPDAACSVALRAAHSVTARDGGLWVTKGLDCSLRPRDRRRNDPAASSRPRRESIDVPRSIAAETPIMALNGADAACRRAVPSGSGSDIDVHASPCPARASRRVTLPSRGRRPSIRNLARRSAVLTVATDNDQRPTWSRCRARNNCCAPSKLGLSPTGSASSAARDQGIRRQADSRWEQPWGELPLRARPPQRTARSPAPEQAGAYCDERPLPPVRRRHRPIRYELPEQAGLKTAKIADEITEFDWCPRARRSGSPPAKWNQYERLSKDAGRCRRHRAHPDDRAAASTTSSVCRSTRRRSSAYSEIMARARRGRVPRYAGTLVSETPCVVRDLRIRDAMAHDPHCGHGAARPGRSDLEAQSPANRTSWAMSAGSSR